jgi:hypothetical protein
MAPRRNPAEEEPLTPRSATIGQAFVERRRDGDVLFVTPGGTDPIFTSVEVADLVSFLTSAPEAGPDEDDE